MNNVLTKKRRCIVVDFEVLSDAGFWMCCMKDYTTKAEHTIINDRDELIRVYNKNKNTIWIGYNIKHYDQFIFKSILLGLNPCDISKSIIEDGINPWSINKEINKLKLNIFDVKTSDKSLKQLELFMGEDIQESSVSFKLETYPTNDEIEELSKYCLHDVRMTLKVFETFYFEYESYAGLIDYFKLDDSMFAKSKAQLSSIILEAKRPFSKRNDMYDFHIIDTIQLSKYDYIREWYKNIKNESRKTFTTTVYGVPIKFGLGGTHSARKKYKGKGFIINSDVSSFYPNIMVEYNLLSRNVLNPRKYKEILDTRLQFKRDNNPIEKCLKLLLNGSFGASLDKFNDLYDARQGTGLCVNGQLLLLDLIEKVELKFRDRATFIQCNTDGVMFKFESQEDVDKYIEICNSWCSRVKLNLEHDYIDRIFQKDVNNYIFIDKKGKIKSTGSYLKKLDITCNDLPIINKALNDKILYNVSIEDTINNCNDLMQFQKCIKVSKSFSHVIVGNKQLHLKVIRVFANKDKDGTLIRKVDLTGKDIKIANSPENVFIDNGCVANKAVPNNLDRQWYIDLANKRLNDFINGKTNDLDNYFLFKENEAKLISDKSQELYTEIRSMFKDSNNNNKYDLKILENILNLLKNN